MLKKIIFILFVALYTTVSYGESPVIVSMQVVTDYKKALEPEVWKNAPAHGVPASITGTVTISKPELAFHKSNPDVFFQNKNFIVCWRSCDREQDIPLRQLPDGTLVVETRLDENGRANPAFQVANVYFWLERLFSKMSEMGYTPSKQLKVLVNRPVPDPQQGTRLTNNAFFNGSDWTLSFLPSENHWYTPKKNRLLPSQFDPMVIMHECTHSVFEDLLGKILNPEILGLHEAFADFFPAVILDSPQLGPIMMRGKPLRRLDIINPYTPGMESHDLGNVVGPVLWKIRDKFKNKGLIDTAILQTVIKLGNNTYASAGDVMVANLMSIIEVAQRATPEEASEVTQEFINELTKIWKSTGLTPTPSIRIAPDTIRGKANSKNYVTMGVNMYTPPNVGAEFGIAVRESTIITLLERRPSKIKNTIWFRLSIQDPGVSETPLWILFDAEKSAIVTAFDLSLQMVTPTESTSYKALTQIGESLAQILGYKNIITAIDEALNQNMPQAFFVHPVNVTHTRTSTSINDQIVPVWRHEADFQKNTFVYAIGYFIGQKTTNVVKQMKHVKLYTVHPSYLNSATGKCNEALVPVQGQCAVGAEIEFLTGMKLRMMIDSFGNEAPKAISVPKAASPKTDSIEEQLNEEEAAKTSN